MVWLYVIFQAIVQSPIVYNSLWPHVLQHTRAPYRSPSPAKICPSSCPMHWMPSSHLFFWCPLLLLPSIFPSLRDFSNESSVWFRWPKYWNFSFSISPSNEYSGWISFKIYWFRVLAVQGTFRSLLQHHSLKASILCHSAFFMVQLLQS